MGSARCTVRGMVVPALRYRDLDAAIDWLCQAFGFERHLVVAGDGGRARYAQLAFGDGMIMLGPVGGSPLDRLMTQPEAIGGATTQACYLLVDDVRAHCAQARAAGAEILIDAGEGHDAGRGYSCRDPEGHIWTFGSYDPLQRRPAPRARFDRQRVTRAGIAVLALAGHRSRWSAG